MGSTKPWIFNERSFSVLSFSNDLKIIDKGSKVFGNDKTERRRTGVVADDIGQAIVHAKLACEYAPANTTHRMRLSYLGLLATDGELVLESARDAEEIGETRKRIVGDRLLTALPRAYDGGCAAPAPLPACHRVRQGPLSVDSNRHRAA